MDYLTFKITLAIRLSLQVYMSDKYRAWALAWLDGSDRSKSSADAAYAAAAAAAAYAAAAYAAAYAAAAAADAAYADAAYADAAERSIRWSLTAGASIKKALTFLPLD